MYRKSCHVLKRLRCAVHFAYERTHLYQRLYGSCPRINSLADFKALPLLSRDALLCHAQGLIDCLSTATSPTPACDGILGALNPLDLFDHSFPFTPVENACDFERRYERVHAILRYAGVKERDKLLVICDGTNIYFASDLEDILTKHDVTVLLRDDLTAEELGSRVAEHGPESILLVTRRAFPAGAIPKSSRNVITFQRWHRFPSTACFQKIDVYCTRVIPWAGARRHEEGYYRTNELFSNGPQMYFERDKRQRLVLTLLACHCRPTILPLIRFVTSDRVSSLVESRFGVRRKDYRR